MVLVGVSGAEQRRPKKVAYVAKLAHRTPPLFAQPSLGKRTGVLRSSSAPNFPQPLSCCRFGQRCFPLTLLQSLSMSLDHSFLTERATRCT